ncbi:MAG: hypothetical protein DME33_10010 [Verrucomicrobia bacterium]|nr:MAG: hypothetical protein DME33_10010 [Verrucomicrobiota bacterium]
MSIEEIRELKHTEPFSPFNIVMKDGRVVWVAKPRRIALSPTGKTVAVYEGSTVSFFVVQRIAQLEPNAQPPTR